MGEKDSNGKGTGLFLVVFGIIFLLTSLGYLEWDAWLNFDMWAYFLPVIIIALGIVYLFGK
ncbi:MAG: DUF5668 domain-containing protein [archaeon]